MSKLFRTITTKNDNAPAANTLAAYSRIFIRDLRVDMMIGVYDSEKNAAQPVVINLEADFTAPHNWRGDSYENVICYDTIAKAVRKIAASGHVNLVETLAEHIADFCMQDKRTTGVTVRVEKTAVFPDARSAGVEIRRLRAAQ
jgi:dihydroneopterin aldolase